MGNTKIKKAHFGGTDMVQDNLEQDRNVSCPMQSTTAIKVYVCVHKSVKKLTLIAASTGFFAAAKKEEKSSFRCTMQFG
jgi:hypothetical protein